MPSHLTEFSIKQWLLQKLFTALAVLRTSQSHLETEESLCPIPLATQLQDWMDFFLFRKQLQQSQAIKKEWEKSIAKALSIPRWKDGKKIPLPARKDMITFNCKFFSVSYSSCLSANEAYLPQTYRGGILPWPQISLVGVATLDWPEMGICG